MRLVVFDYNHHLGLGFEHEVLYLDGNTVHAENLEDVAQKIKNFKPDLIIEREYNDGRAHYRQLFSMLEGIPKAWWCIDAHTYLVNHVSYAKQFDYVFCAQSWFIPLFENQVRAQLFWLPLCHTQSLPEYEEWLLKPKPERTIEVSFVGNIRSIHIDRKEYVTSLKLTMGDKFFAATQDYPTMLETLSKSKKTWNCSLNDDLNFRVWEALATDTPLVTDFVHDIPNISNLARQIHRIYRRKTEKRLTEAVEYPHISTTEFIKGNHTLTHRFKQMLWMIESGAQYAF